MLSLNCGVAKISAVYKQATGSTGTGDRCRPTRTAVFISYGAETDTR